MANSSDRNTGNAPVHTAEVHVRWSDFDRFGHLNNAAYIELAQEARNIFALEEFIGRGHDVPAVFIRRLDASYMSPILPDTSTVVVETRVTRVGRTSFTTSQSIIDRHGTVACVIECVQIAVDLKTSTPRAITANELKVLSRAAGTEVPGGADATGEGTVHE